MKPVPATARLASAAALLALSGCYYPYGYYPYGYYGYPAIPTAATQQEVPVGSQVDQNGVATQQNAAPGYVAPPPAYPVPAYYPAYPYPAYPAYYGWPWWGPSVSIGFGYWGGGHCCYHGGYYHGGGGYYHGGGGYYHGGGGYHGGGHGH